MDIKKKVKSLPTSAGVYLMKDKNGRIIYVGKAANLKKRVLSYFNRPQTSYKNEVLLKQVSDFQAIATVSEHEAFLLESRLIKQLKPRYNISLKDDKSFPFIKITKEDYPRLFMGRRKPRENMEYIGPYTNAKLLRLALKSLRRTFPFCDCHKFPQRECLDFHLGLCTAPCIDKISKINYKKNIQDFKRFLKKGSIGLIKYLERKMQHYAKIKKFEEAIKLREKIKALGLLSQQARTGSWDIFDLPTHQSRQAGRCGVSPKGENPKRKVPRLLSRGAPQRPPYRIEAFDVSNIFGNEAVGSMITFLNGAPYKNAYRRFRIRMVSGIDDYKMLREILKRRYKRVIEENLERPDLIIIDGGKGHLNIASGELRNLGLDIPIIAIAKDQELIYTVKKNAPVKLERESQVLQLVQRIRDEAHRFAIKYHKLLRSKKTFQRY